MPEEKVEADAWLADEAVTHEKIIEGKSVKFKSKPSGTMIDHLASRFRSDTEKANFEMVKYIVLEPRIDEPYWAKMHAGIRMQILQECLSICGLQPGFLR